MIPRDYYTYPPVMKPSKYRLTIRLLYHDLTRAFPHPFDWKQCPNSAGDRGFMDEGL